jgi:rhamnosyltransferase
MIFFSILYNPGENALGNIIAAMKNGFVPVVYFNSVDKAVARVLSTLNIKIMGENVNAGLGIAFDELEEYLKKIGETNFVYFDQDTVVEDEVWQLILDTYESYFLKEDAGMLFYSNKGDETSDVVVSSGCLFSMNVIENIGKHSSEYFVEGVDYEFCLRLKKHGFKIYNVYLSGIDHGSLQDGRVLKMFGFSLKIRAYGDQRLKDFNRSHLRLIRDSFQSKQYCMTLFFLKSLLVFNVSEFYSRILIAVL